MSYHKLIKEIRGIVDNAMSSKQADNNLTTTHSNWEIGKRLVVDEQQGKDRAAYGQEVLAQVALELNKRYGRGYGQANLGYMRQFYQVYKKSEIHAGLSWSHYRLLVQVQDVKQRSKLEKQTIKSGWSKRQLAEQVKLLRGESGVETVDFLQRPTGRSGLLQVRHLVENGKELSFLDPGFHYWVDAKPGEVEGMEHKSVLELSHRDANFRVVPYVGSSRDLYVYTVTLDHVVDGSVSHFCEHRLPGLCETFVEI